MLQVLLAPVAGRSLRRFVAQLIEYVVDVARLERLRRRRGGCRVWLGGTRLGPESSEFDTQVHFHAFLLGMSFRLRRRLHLRHLDLGEEPIKVDGVGAELEMRGRRVLLARQRRRGQLKRVRRLHFEHVWQVHPVPLSRIRQDRRLVERRKFLALQEIGAHERSLTAQALGDHTVGIWFAE